MDNKDQYNNPVGDDLNLSHEGQLPSIWDNISQELNAFDEMESDITPLAVDDTINIDTLSKSEEYSVIREGFQQNFSAKEPPKFMWDKIEQDLESFTVTDASSDFSVVKTGFEQTYKENKVPNFIWEDLAEQMDNPVPKTSKKNDDYSFVKRGFEKKYSAVVVPLFSWKDLAQRMDNEAALADTPDKFSIIKESFDKEYAHQKPAITVWGALHQQLRIETYWGRLCYYLETSTSVRKAAIFTVIGLLIGGGKACLFDRNIPVGVSTTESEAVAFFSNQESQGEIFDKIIEAPFRKSGNGNSVTNVEVLPSVDFAKKATEALLEIKEQHNIKQAQKEFVAVALSVTNEQEEAFNNIVEYETGVGTNKNKTNTEVLVKTTVPTGNSLNQQLPAANDISGIEDDLITKGSENKTTDYAVLKNSLDLFSNSNDLNWLGEDILEVKAMGGGSGMGILVQKHVSDPAIARMEEDNFVLVRQAQKGKKVRLELGPSIRIGTSLLLGENTFKAFDQQQTASTEMKVTGTAGIILNYHFSLNDAIVLGTYPYAKVKQSFADYTADGNYVQKEIDLTFFDFVFGYQRTLIRYNTLGKVPSKIYTRLDVGLGYLMKSTTKVNDVLVNGKGWFNKFNVSVGLRLGNTHEINQFILDYGITGNVGVNDLIRPSNTSFLKPSHLLNVGAFIGLRYIILPRLEPSKKQRQFDWSPPFYIEEPMF